MFVFDVIIVNHSPLVRLFFIFAFGPFDPGILFIVAVIFDINMAFLHIVTLGSKDILPLTKESFVGQRFLRKFLQIR